MHQHYEFYTSEYQDPLYKRVVYYLALFMVGFIPGLLTGYLIWF
ncbi:MAG: hypothetical protein DHS20C01_09210 [marine bacterium B5-7]|nr:MAG: hypothetical protein DHS20C01_09210 [marine bacterium B5-7]